MISIAWIGQHTPIYTRISPRILKKQGNFCGHIFNLSLKMGTNALFIVTHLDQKEHGSWALTNTCTIRNI
jgi:hypothetical protein